MSRLFPALLLTSAAALAQPPAPRLESSGAVTHLMVEGKPWLALGGELSNNAASTAENVRRAWPELAKMHLNTALVGVGWGWIEAQPGRYDFSTIDAILRDARAANLRVVLLWFGSWKNGTSSYTPAWVKRDWQKYPIARDREGKGREILSAFSQTNRDADARAYSALLAHLRTADVARTVIMTQLENEVGLLGDSRDHSPEADQAFAAPVPAQLLNYLEGHRADLPPETRKLWESAGSKTSGTWAEVFGGGPATDEAFMAWHYARYMNYIAEAGKRAYPLPVYVNAWLVQPNDKTPGDYPSGGPQAHNQGIWRAAAPSIDFYAPDIYLPEFASIAAQYSRNRNPLFIPETIPNAANAFLAFGQLNAQMYSPFAIEQRASADSPLAKAYAVLAQLAPAILEAQSKSAIRAVMAASGTAPQKLALGHYLFDAAPGRGWGFQASASGPGYAIFIQTGPDEFLAAGAGLNVRFSSTDPAAPMASLASVEEVRKENGAWRVLRRLAGDDIGMGGDDRASLQLTAEPRILRFSLYTYR